MTQLNECDFDRATIQYCRAIINDSNAPIEIVPGNAAPYIEGDGPYYTKLSRKRWAYHPSTRKLIVGEKWLLQHQAFYKEFYQRREPALLVGYYATYKIYDNGWCYVVCDGNRSYHSLDRSLRGAAKRAKKAFDKQDEMDSALEKFPLNHVWVSVEDSIYAGNCKPETQRFKALLIDRLGATGDIGAVCASTILKIRNDSYTRRACQHAVTRKLANNVTK